LAAGVTATFLRLSRGSWTVCDPRQTPLSRRALLRAGGGVAVALGLSGCLVSTTPYTETVGRSFDPGDATALAVETDSGDVTAAVPDDLSATVGLRTSNGDARLAPP